MQHLLNNIYVFTDYICAAAVKMYKMVEILKIEFNTQIMKVKKLTF